MRTWTQFATDAPELAERARAVLTSTTNAVLATLRRDGSPRVSGIDPFFAEGELWIGSMPGARKGQDLRRDPRVALHCIPWESRRVREGREAPGDADAKLTGRAVLVTDPLEAARIFATLAHDRRADPATDAPGTDAPAADEQGPDAPGDLFRIEPETVTVLSVDGEELVVDRWSATDGRRTFRRT